MRKLILKTLELLPDKQFLQLKYRLKMKKKLDLKNPKTFNEKLQWLKLHDRKPEYTTMVDKYEVKKYVADIIGEEYIIPTLGVWDRFEDIDFDSLPDQFVLKCTHDSGGLVIVRDKSKMDVAAAKKKIEQSLKNNYYKHGREWAYKNVPRRIIAEELLDLDENTAEFKMFCTDGKVNWTMVCTGAGHSENSRTNDGYDRDFNHLPITFTYKNAEKVIEKPANYAEIIKIGETLSNGICQVRIDTYVLGNKIYFGEITLYHCSGFCEFNPPEWDKKFGDQITLPKI